MVQLSGPGDHRMTSRMFQYIAPGYLALGRTLEAILLYAHFMLTLRYAYCSL